MKNLKGIFLIFFIFFSVFTGFVGASSKAFADKNIPAINIIEIKKDVFINSKALEKGLCTLADNSAVACFSGRNFQNNTSSGNSCIHFSDSQLELLSNNLYSKLCIEGNIACISLLLFQIQPNAP